MFRLLCCNIFSWCLQVWNPCFDVTPGTLIEGIITEEGVVPRDAGTGTHQVAKFMAARQEQQQQQHANGNGAAGKQVQGLGWRWERRWPRQVNVTAGTAVS